MQSSNDGTQHIPTQPPPRDPDREFNWEKAYEFANSMLKLSEIGFEFWQEEQYRERKLKESPNGFPLDGVGIYCPICSHRCGEGEAWFAQHGITCITCKEAIDRGVLPASVASDEDSWYSVRDLEHIFAIKAKVVRRWIKAGILKARTITRERHVPVHILIIEENKGVLPPKELVQDRSVRETMPDGTYGHHQEPWYRFVNPFEHLKDYKIMDHLKQLSEEDWLESEPRLSVTPAFPYLFSA